MTHVLQNDTPFDADTEDLNGVPYSPGQQSGIVAWMIPGAYDGDITFEATFDGENWFEVTAYNVSDSLPATPSITDEEAFYIPTVVGQNIRARMSGGSTGSLTVYCNGSHPLQGLRGA